MLLLKQELKTCNIALDVLKYDNFESIFLSNFRTSLYFDTNSWAFAYLLKNMSSLFVIILTYFTYISSLPGLYLAGSENIKDNDRTTSIMITSIGNT